MNLLASFGLGRKYDDSFAVIDFAGTLDAGSEKTYSSCDLVIVEMNRIAARKICFIVP